MDNKSKNIFKKALDEIAKEYQVRKISTTYAQIEFDILFDDFNYVFIGVLYENNRVLLTDLADYAELLDYSDEEMPRVEEICLAHNVTFNNYHIEKDYHSNQDIKDYLDCLLELQKEFID